MMKNVLNFSLTGLVFLLATAAAYAGPIDAKVLYEAIDSPIESVPAGGDSHYAAERKTIPGVVDCRRNAFGYQCSFGTHMGFSMADRAYEMLNLPEVALKEDEHGKWYRKSVGALICTRLVLKNLPERTGDTPPATEYSKCKVTLDFGDTF